MYEKHMCPDGPKIFDKTNNRYVDITDPAFLAWINELKPVYTYPGGVETPVLVDGVPLMVPAHVLSPITVDTSVKPDYTTEPANIELVDGGIIDGIATIRVTWDHIETNGVWSWEEAVIAWKIPKKYDTLDDILEYFADNYDAKDKILDWAQGSKVNYKELI